MNYRHAFHAGNFADCVKHALFVHLLATMQAKPGGVMVLDTHAGIGRYDLEAAPAQRTGEWRAGIARLRTAPDPPLAAYVGLVDEPGWYPGSPALARRMLRPQDRLVLCELHPEDHATLRRLFAGDRQVAVHRRDGWEAPAAFLPPPERRALVLVDPPYEAEGEFERLVAALRRGWGRFGTGVFAAWYPIKHLAPVRALHLAIRESGLRDVLAAGLWLRAPLDAARLNGCGLLIVNPPFGFAAAAQAILTALLARLGDGEAGAGWAVERLVDE